jgi:hypothetical protein
VVPKLDDDDLKYDDCNVLVRQYGVFSVLSLHWYTVSNKRNKVEMSISMSQYKAFKENQVL